MTNQRSSNQPKALTSEALTSEALTSPQGSNQQSSNQRSSNQQSSNQAQPLTSPQGSNLFSPSRCYRPDEIATTLGLSVRSVYRMISDIDDPLPAYRPTGTVLRVHGHALIAWLDRRKVNPLIE